MADPVDIYIYIIHVQGREDRDEIIIKIINRIYKIFFPPFLYEYNSKNGRNRKILYCKYKIENDSRRRYTNKYMPFFSVLFCFVLVFFLSFICIRLTFIYYQSRNSRICIINDLERKKTRERRKKKRIPIDSFDDLRFQSRFSHIIITVLKV